MTAPECVASVICKGVDPNEGRKHFQKSTLPSVSTIMRAELSLDIAMSMLRRVTYNPSDMVRFMWSDSSPLCGFDWLWAQSHEIKRSEVVAICKASHELVRATRRFAWEHVEHGDSDDVPL